MLAALLIAVVAVLFAGVAVAAALGIIEVTSSDAARARACASAQDGVEFGLHRLCWVLARPDVTLGCDASSVTVESVEAGELGWPVAARFVRLTSEASCGRARVRAVSLVLMQPTALPRGVSVTEDAELRAALTVSGCGMYVGGSVRGRELASLVDADGAEAPGVPTLPADPAPDHAWGGRWPVAGVHAGGGIWAAGAEIHDLDPVPAAYVNDTDTHAASPPVVPAVPWTGSDLPDMVELPDAVWLASARAHALDPADALADGVLHLDRLPPALPTGEPGSAEVAGCAEPAAGYLVCVADDASDGALVITGRRDPLWVPVTVVVEGDACLGDADMEPSPVEPTAPAVFLRGALVVTGHLEVAATSSVTGHLDCRRLLVAAPLSVRLGSGWREQPAIGSLEGRLVARE